MSGLLHGWVVEGLPGGTIGVTLPMAADSFDGAMGGTGTPPDPVSSKDKY